MKQKKTVTNILENIGKARDLVTKGTVKDIYNRIPFFEKLSADLRTQMTRYIKNASYELDFTYYDLKELSEETYAFIKDMPEKFLFNSLCNELVKVPLTIENFNAFSMNVGYETKVQTVLNQFYKDVAYIGLTILVWSRSDDKLSFDEQITKTLRSFLKEGNNDSNITK